jgi:hypothetical protein
MQVTGSDIYGFIPAGVDIAASGLHPALMRRLMILSDTSPRGSFAQAIVLHYPLPLDTCALSGGVWYGIPLPGIDCVFVPKMN